MLDSVDKIIGMAKPMTYNGKKTLVKIFGGPYETVAKLTKEVMVKIEKVINRIPGIEKWAVDVPLYYVPILVDLFLADTPTRIDDETINTGENYGFCMDVCFEYTTNHFNFCINKF